MSQYQIMAYRIALPWPAGEMGMGPVYPLPDGWTPLAVERQSESVLVLCYQQIGAPPSGGNAPVLTSVTPASLPAGSTPATVDVIGSGFDTSCAIYANASPRATFYIDATHLQYTARPDLEAGPSVVQIAVQGDNGTSNALTFHFT